MLGEFHIFLYKKIHMTKFSFSTYSSFNFWITKWEFKYIFFCVRWQSHVIKFTIGISKRHVKCKIKIFLAKWKHMKWRHGFTTSRSKLEHLKLKVNCHSHLCIQRYKNMWFFSQNNNNSRHMCEVTFVVAYITSKWH